MSESNERRMLKTYCIVLASGTGTRFGGDLPKQFVQVGGRMIVEHTLVAVARAPAVDEIVMVVSAPWRDAVERAVAQSHVGKPVRIVLGGTTRLASCRKGVESIADDDAKVLVHNGVQPFVTAADLDKCVAALDEYEAVTVGSASVYTVLELDEKRELRRIADRRFTANDLGPECFRIRLLRKVLDLAVDDETSTNLTGLVLRSGLGKVFVVDGDPANVKITYPDDFMLARARIGTGEGR